MALLIVIPRSLNPGTLCANLYTTTVEGDIDASVERFVQQPRRSDASLYQRKLRICPLTLAEYDRGRRKQS
jgi:hypothetical protein